MSGAPPALAPVAQLACYGEWLKVEVALRYALTYPWSSEAWTEVRRQIPWLLAGGPGEGVAGWFN